MVEKELRSREDRRKGTERRESNTLYYELQNFDRQDKRSGSDRRSGKEKKIK